MLMFYSFRPEYQQTSYRRKLWLDCSLIGSELFLFSRHIYFHPDGQTIGLELLDISIQVLPQRVSAFKLTLFPPDKKLCAKRSEGKFVSVI